MMTFQSIEPLWGLSGIGSAPVETTGERNQPTMFTDIFHSMIDNVKETDAAKNKAIVKACESFRVDAAQKKFLKSLKK